jgi:hypothetical protein
VSNPFSQVNNNNNLAEVPKRVEAVKSGARQPAARRSSITSCQEDFSKWKQQLGDRRKRLSGALLQSTGASAPPVKIEGPQNYPPSTSSSKSEAYLTCRPSTSSSSKTLDYPSCRPSTSSYKDEAYKTCQPSTSSGAGRYTSPPSYLNCRPSTSAAKAAKKPPTPKANTKNPKRKSGKSANWKSRQPMQCEECKKFFSNKFNLKQVINF